MSQKKPTMRKAGRPRVHKEDSTKVVSFRVPEDVAGVIEHAIAVIKLAGQQSHDPNPVIVLDALKARLKILSNRLPQKVNQAIKLIDEKAMPHYEYLEEQREARKQRLVKPTE
jgi:hypothetical protein